jgi:hypothetical protein
MRARQDRASHASMRRSWVLVGSSLLEAANARAAHRRDASYAELSLLSLVRIGKSSVELEWMVFRTVLPTGGCR